MKWLYNGLGIFFVAVGVLGIFLPLLPTTPFLLLAGFFFGKGSDKFNLWLLNHPVLGPPVKDWRTRGVVRLRAKLMASAVFATSGIVVFTKKTIPNYGRAGFVICAVLLLSFLWTRPSK